MNEFDFELERDRIEFAYDEKIQPIRNQLRENELRVLDLQQQFAESETQRIQMEATLQLLETEKKREILELKTNYRKEQAQ